MATTADMLYVTYVDAYNDLLKIWGQPNRTCATYIEKQLFQLGPEFNRSPSPSPSAVHKGMFCFAKYEDGKYYRGRIISDVLNNAVMIFFIDYGNKDRVELSNIRIRNDASESVITKIVAQAAEFYLANVKSRGNWSPDVINNIRVGLCCCEYKYRVIYQLGNERLIQINYRNEDYSGFLIRQELVRPISVKDQITILKNALENQQSMEQLSSRNSRYSRQVPPLPDKDGFCVSNKGSVPQEQLETVNQRSLPVQSQNRSNFFNGERQFSMNPSINAAYNQNNNNVMHSETKSEPVINNVVIEALANQLKQHLLKDNSTSSPETTVHGYITQVLDVGTTHNVYVSYVDDGPWSFSIQLVSSEFELNQLMDDLAACTFQPVKRPLVLGYPCIAKSKQYGNYCRGVVVNLSHSAVKIFFVDFGNTEDLPLSSLFEMPAQFFKIKAMSQKFALSGLQKIKQTGGIKKAFADVVGNELLVLHVTSLEGENLPTCDLYLKDVNIKKILNNKLRQVRKWNCLQPPSVGDIASVLVTWVDSPQKFYVQLKRCDNLLNSLNTELTKCGESGEHFQPEEIVPGSLCICFFTGDHKWYRAVITSVVSLTAVTVFYVDYGNTEVVDYTMIKKFESDLVMQMKTQAIKCCLHGYENKPPEPGVESILKELIFEKELTLEVTSVGDDYIVVKLFDTGEDISSSLNQQKQNSKSVSNAKDKILNCDSGEDWFENEGRTKNHFNTQTGIDHSPESRDSKDLENDEVAIEVSDWRSCDKRQEPSSKSKDKKTGKAREAKNGSSSKGNNEKRNGKSSRYGSKSKKRETATGNESANDSDKNWRNSKSSTTKNIGGASKSNKKSVESLSNRLIRVARTTEAKGLEIDDELLSKSPVKLCDIAISGSSFKQKNVEIGSSEDAIVTYFTSPSEIYVQLVSSKDEFRGVMNDIQNYYNTKQPLLSLPKKGDAVICRFKADKILYRAKVIETNPLVVRYVDFGNEEATEKENLWPMAEKFLELESQCLKCTLPNIKPAGGDAWPAPDKQIDELFEHEKYSCTFLRRLENEYEVDLIISENGKNIRDELISAGFALPVDDIIESPPAVKKSPAMNFDLMRNEVFSVFISHVVHASEFYIQIRDRAVKAIENEIREYITSNPFSPPSGNSSVCIEELCLVHVKDDIWRRGKLIESKGTDAIVRLIDYGEKLRLKKNQIRPIPDNLAEYPPQAFQCSLLFDENKSKSEITDKFMACNKKIVAAFIHEVIDERLIVSLYSIMDEELGFLGFVRDAPVEISPIASLPIITRKMIVAPSHITSPKEIYVHIMDEIGDLENLSSTMMLAYFEEREDHRMEGGKTEGQICAAKSIADGCWYRAKILSLNKKSAEIFYIDFGNTELVPVENLKKLDPSLYKKHAYARRISLNVEYDNDSENYVNEKLIPLILEKECIGYFVKVNDVLYAELIVENICVTSQLFSIPSVKEKVRDLFEGFNFKPSDEVIDGSKVFISHVSNPGEFWVHVEGIFFELDAFQNKLQVACANGNLIKDVEVGDVVGTLFTDQLWYRALVTAVRNDIVSVELVDYGKNLDVDKRDNKIVSLDESLKKPAPFARKCSLKGCWNDDATSRFEDIVMNQEDTFTLVKLNGGGDEVDLLQNEISITDQLINEGYGVSLCKETVYISHVNSPDDFYVRKESSKTLYNRIINGLLDADSFEESADAEVNELYCAKSPADELWYRVKILRKDAKSNGIDVFYVDSGDFGIVTDIRKLPPLLKIIRPLSVHCCLVNMSGGTWSDAACNYFLEHLNYLPLEMEVVRREKQKSIVRLFRGIIDLGETMTEMRDDVETEKQEPGLFFEINDGETWGEKTGSIPEFTDYFETDVKSQRSLFRTDYRKSDESDAALNCIVKSENDESSRSSSEIYNEENEWDSLEEN